MMRSQPYTSIIYQNHVPCTNPYVERLIVEIFIVEILIVKRLVIERLVSIELLKHWLLVSTLEHGFNNLHVKVK
jgi:hypothetical protein